MGNLTLKELGRRAFETTKAKGFHDEPIDIPRALMLTVSELAEALAAMNNENDQEQWYSYTEYPTNESKNGVRRLIFNEHTRFDSFVDVPSGYYRKATVEEIVEYFKNNEK